MDNIYVVTCKENSRTYLVKAEDKKSAIKKIKDFTNDCYPAHPPYTIPYTMKDFSVEKLEDFIADIDSFVEL